MKVVVGSAFRNSVSRNQLDRYLAQVLALRVHAGPPHQFRIIAAEGDSSDGTRSELVRRCHAAGLELDLVPVDHGGPWFGSTEARERMVTMSRVGNAIYDAVQPDDDVLVYIESDLIWDANTIGSMVDMAVRRDGCCDVFSPLVFAGENFYDVWGYRGLDGSRFAPFKPYHSSLNQYGLTEVSSVGSCLVMRGEVARSCRIVDDLCLVGWCQDARAKGYRIAVHSGFHVRHP